MTSSWRFPAGVAIFVLGFCAPLAIPLVLASSLPAGWKTAVSGALALGVPEVIMIAAAAVMGQEGFVKLKGHVGRFFIISAAWIRIFARESPLPLFACRQPCNPYLLIYFGSSVKIYS